MLQRFLFFDVWKGWLCIEIRSITLGESPVSSSCFTSFVRHKYTKYTQTESGMKESIKNSDRIRGTGISYPLIYHRNQQNVGKYTSPMDGMGV